MECPVSYSIVPGDKWATLPQSFRRLVVRDCLLAEATYDGATSGGLVVGSGNNVPATSSTSKPRPSIGDSQHDDPVQWTPPAPDTAGCPGNLSAAFAIAAMRWADMMEHLFVNTDPRKAAAYLEELRRRTADGRVRVSPDTLGELWPDLGELMRDGATGLLSLPALPQLYASLTLTFAYACSSQWDLPVGGTAADTGSLEVAEDDEARRQELASCTAYVQGRKAAVEQAMKEMRYAEECGDPGAAEQACNTALSLDPTQSEPFLYRAGVRLMKADRRQCLEDLRVYLILSARRGFVAEQHVTAYWRMAQAFLKELDFLAEKQKTVLNDNVFTCFVDQADRALHLAFRYDSSGQLVESGAALHALLRIEAHRAGRRTASEMLDAPVVPDTPADGDEEQSSTEPPLRDYAVPWPIDLCAGMPDTALFSRKPTIGSSQQHEALELLFLDARGILDLMVTLQSLAARSSAFANRNDHHLHWKYRPKPVHVHLQAPVVERLAHALLCIMIAKQVGTVLTDEDIKESQGLKGMSATGAAGAASAGPSYTTEETRHDRFLCALFTSLVFCRTLTTMQRAEVDRLLALLVFASTDIAWMRRTFPWLDIDDNRLTIAAASEHEGEGSNSAGSANTVSSGRTQGGNAGDGSEAGKWRRAINSSSAFGTSVLLFELQHVWIGWLATSGGEFPVSRSAVAPGKEVARLNQALVHDAARRLHLGPRASVPSSALDLDVEAGREQGLSQRKLWALSGRLPVSRERSAIPVSDSEQQEDDPETRFRPVDLRARWVPLLDELASVPSDAWRLNPCCLDPVSWTYDIGSLADPFRTLSCRLRASMPTSSSAAQTEDTWFSRINELVGFTDWPLPAPGSNEILVIEVVWEHVMAQLKALSSVFNTHEAANAARARAMVSMVGDLPGEVNAVERKGKPVVDEKASKKQLLPRRASFQTLLAHNMKQRMKQGSSDAACAEGTGDEEHAELTQEKIDRELAALKRRRHEAGLDTELRDYVTLSSVRKKEADWWGKASQNASAYKEAIDAGGAATWNPAPPSCAPLQFRLRICVGTPWQVAKTASFRNAAFDAIDARALLCAGAGILGLCTWFDSILKPTPYAYIQTRQCEELFAQKLQSLKGPTLAAVVAAGGVAPPNTDGKAQTFTPVPPPAPLPFRRPSPRKAASLTVAGVSGASRPPPASQVDPETPSPPPRRVVLTKGGIVRWSDAPRWPRPPPVKRIPSLKTRATWMMLPSRSATPSVQAGLRSPSTSGPSPAPQLPPLLHASEHGSRQQTPRDARQDSKGHHQRARSEGHDAEQRDSQEHGELHLRRRRRLTSRGTQGQWDGDFDSPNTSEDRRRSSQAATRIQAAYRGKRARQHVRNFQLARHKAAATIQAVFRGGKVRTTMHFNTAAVGSPQSRYSGSHALALEDEMQAAATKIQAHMRGCMIRKQQKLIGRQHRENSHQGKKRSKYVDTEHAATAIQAVFRGARTRRSFIVRRTPVKSAQASAASGRERVVGERPAFSPDSASSPDSALPKWQVKQIDLEAALDGVESAEPSVYMKPLKGFAALKSNKPERGPAHVDEPLQLGAGIQKADSTSSKPNKRQFHKQRSPTENAPLGGKPSKPSKPPQTSFAKMELGTQLDIKAPVEPSSSGTATGFKGSALHGARHVRAHEVEHAEAKAEAKEAKDLKQASINLVRFSDLPGLDGLSPKRSEASGAGKPARAKPAADSGGPSPSPSDELQMKDDQKLYDAAVKIQNAFRRKSLRRGNQAGTTVASPSEHYTKWRASDAVAEASRQALAARLLMTEAPQACSYSHVGTSAADATEFELLPPEKKRDVQLEMLAKERQLKQKMHLEHLHTLRSDASRQPAHAGTRKKEAYVPPYAAESDLFQQLVHESISERVGSGMLQSMLNIAVRAEPLFAEAGLTYFGAASLPVRHDFVPWDSSLESIDITASNWPCAVDRFTGAALGGTQNLAPTGPRSEDPLVSFSRYWRQPEGRETSAALGPRLLRIRRIGCHTSLVFPQVGGGNLRPTHKRRCSNIAFCKRYAVMVGDPTVGADAHSLHCFDCECVWYCSASCQAIHRTAHSFECEALRGMRAAREEFGEPHSGTGRRHVMVTSLLEQVLAKQFSMVAQPQEPLKTNARGDGVQEAIHGGARPQTGVATVPDSFEDGRADPAMFGPRTAMPPLGVYHSNSSTESATRHRGLFDVRQSHSHTAAAVVRLLSRWVVASKNSPALRDLIFDDGLIFCIITGLCQTKHYLGQQPTKHGIVAMAVHRMSLHIAASQQWRALGPSLVPPKKFRNEGLQLQGIECAQYSAYYAFFQPMRMPFWKLRLLKPVICLAWGRRARDAILALPHSTESWANRSNTLGSIAGLLPSRSSGFDDDPAGIHDSRADSSYDHSIQFSAAPMSRQSSAQHGISSTSGPATARDGLRTFSDVALEHLSNIQLVDGVQLDVPTGKAVFLLYTSAVEGGGVPDISGSISYSSTFSDADKSAWVILLDASRGMQAVASPLPVRELRRCAL